MDVNDFWPKNVPPMSQESLTDLMTERAVTGAGFAAIEQASGAMPEDLNINTARGQEVMRTFAYRALEELAEAHNSEEEAHYLEELIDALNYLLNLWLLQTDPISMGAALWHFNPGLHFNAGNRIHNRRLSVNAIGSITLALGYELGDMLRNRTWMENAQSSYFDGDLWDILQHPIRLILAQFSSWGEFYNYFMAKDAVLKFRLKSKY